MRSGSSSSSSRFKIRPKQVNASTCDFDRCCLQSGDNTGTHLHAFEESYMSTKATAARIYEYGEPDVFRFESMDVPDPVGHEVLVRNTVIGLNFVDIYYRRGTLPVPEFPAIIGDEASGVVEAVGPNVTLVEVGDRVAYADAFGAYTTVRLYPEGRLTVIPDSDDSSFISGIELFADGGRAQI